MFCLDPEPNLSHVSGTLGDIHASRLRNPRGKLASPYSPTTHITSAGIPIPGRITKGAGLGRFIAPRESSIAEYAKVRSGKWCEGIQIVSSWAGGQNWMFPSSGWPFFRNLGGREAWPEKGALGRPVPPCACATAREHWRGVKGNAGGRTSCHNPTADQL